MQTKTLSWTLFIFILFAAIVPTSCKKASDTSGTSASQPLITAVTPTEVKAGQTITITGSGFGANKAASVVTVGGAAADTIISWSDSEIQAVVPEGGLTGPVKAKVDDTDSDEKHLIVLWDKENPDNVVIPGNHASPLHMQLIAEGVGGSILVWNDFRSSDPQQVNIYTQRLNSRGKLIWNADGVRLSTAAGKQFFPQLVSDHNGGAIVVWEDYRNGIEADIYAQRISPSGAVVWSSDAVVCTAAKNQEKPKIVSDGAGGAIIVWFDYRSNSQYEVYAQRINGDGVAQWTANGVAISTASNNPQFLFPEIISDGSGGAIIVWQDYRSSSTWNIYAQRINASGAANGQPMAFQSPPPLQAISTYPSPFLTAMAELSLAGRAAAVIFMVSESTQAGECSGDLQARSYLLRLVTRLNPR